MMIDIEKARKIISGKLQFGNPEHIEAVKVIERDRQAEASAWDGFDIKVEVYRDAKTGLKRTRMTLPESGD